MALTMFTIETNDYTALGQLPPRTVPPGQFPPRTIDPPPDSFLSNNSHREQLPPGQFPRITPT